MNKFSAIWRHVSSIVGLYGHKGAPMPTYMILRWLQLSLQILARRISLSPSLSLSRIHWFVVTQLHGELEPNQTPLPGSCSPSSHELQVLPTGYQNRFADSFSNETYIKIRHDFILRFSSGASNRTALYIF